MKQRLLLSLLMLFVSVGLVKAEITITVPKGAAPVISVSGITTGKEPVLTVTANGATVATHTFTSSALSYTVTANKEQDQTVTISNNPHKVLTITGAKSITSLTVDNTYDTLEEVNIPNTGVKTITWTAASGLKKLDISNNPGVNMGVLPTSLESLNISGNEFTIPGLAAWDLSSYTKLKELKLDGNRLVNVTLPADFEKNGGKLDAGTQDFTYAVKDGGKANENLNISTFNWGLGVEMVSASQSDWKKQSGTSWVNASNEAHTIGAGNNVVYRFYDSNNNNVYTDGTYECVLTGKNGFKYKLRLTIAPAELTIKKEAVANGTLTIKKGNNALNDGATVTQGDVLSIGVTPDANYEFVQFKDAKNLVLTNNSAWTKNPLECKVEGKFVSSSGEGDVVSITAEMKGELATINYNTPAIETGSIIVKQINADGSLSPVNNKAQLPYGSKLQITLTPQLGYQTKLIINDKVQDLTGKMNDKGQYVIVYEVKENCEITAEFIISTMVKLTAIKNGATITGSFIVRQGTIEDELDAAGLEVASGRPCQVTFILGTNEVLKQLRLNNTEVKKEDITMNTSASGNTYHFTFTPTEDVTIYLSTTKQQVITIKPEATEQTFVYDGKAKAFAFTTEPAGLESKVQVTYKSDADATAKVDAPIRVDRYLVEFAVKEDAQANYSIAPSFIFTDPDDNPYRVEITKATPTITTAPKVTISADKTKYVLSNDGKASVEGEFSLQNPSAPVDNTKAHLVPVKFTPKDDVNYDNAFVWVEVVPEGKNAMDRMAVNIESTLPEGIEDVTLLNNGSTTAKFGDTFVEGTTLIVLVKYAEGVDPKDITLSKTLLDAGTVNPNSDFDDVASRIKGFTYTVPAGTNAETLDVQLSNAPTYTYSVVLKAMDAVTYTGSPIAYDAQNITITGDKNDANATSVNPDYTVSYKLGNTAIEGNPVNAGDYTVCISIKAGNGYKAFYQEYTGKFSIDKATPKVTWPKVQPIAKGQKLKFAGFVGGGSNEISGEFEWLSPESTPKNGDKCKVKFVPDDLTNYEEVTKDDGLMVTVSDLQLITKYAKNGTITITDANGNTYESGTPVTEGTILKITATPDEGFELEGGLKVSGATNNGNGTYTVGETSVEVEATFSVKVLPGNFKVTIPEGGVRGAIISGGGEHVVAADGSISFTVSTLAADANKVSVTATNGTVSKGANGRYTVSNIQANTTVRVSLSNPTALKVDIKESYLNDKKYHIGYVEIADGEATTYYYGDEITVVAYPESGVKFKGWSNGSTDQVLDLTLTGDLTLTASFTGTPTGIEDIETAKVYTGKGFIMVKNVANAEVTVVSISGRLQAKREISGDTQITVPQGIYVVVLQSGDDTKQLKVIVK